MYGALWRSIPGGLPGKLAGTLGLLLAGLAFLFFVVFPLAEPRLPWNDVTVNSPSIGPTQQPAVTPSTSG